MNFTRDAIFDYVARTISADTVGAIVTSVKIRSSASFPCVEIRQVDKVRTKSNVTLDFSDEQHSLTFEVQVFCDETSGGLDECFRLMGIVEGAFNNLHFLETMCNEVENIDPFISRLVARFNRQVADGDVFPSLSANSTDNDDTSDDTDTGDTDSNDISDDTDTGDTDSTSDDTDTDTDNDTE